MNSVSGRNKTIYPMKLIAGLAALGAIVAIVVTSSIAFAEGEQLNDSQRQRIQVNCQSIKSTLNQLHVSDALLRVNRGQFYESLAGKLMDRFNNRLSTNGIDVKGMTSITTSYRTKLDSFRVDYQVYEQQLSEAIRIDCTKNPQEFHDAVASARTKRSKVHDDVTALNQYISDYQLVVKTFADSYNQVSSGVNP